MMYGVLAGPASSRPGRRRSVVEGRPVALGLPDDRHGILAERLVEIAVEVQEQLAVVDRPAVHGVDVEQTVRLADTPAAEAAVLGRVLRGVGLEQIAMSLRGEAPRDAAVLRNEFLGADRRLAVREICD